jgi:hypothetical protein
MTGSDPGEGPLSLLGVTFRRAVTSGRFFLAYGTGISILMALSLGLSSTGFTVGFPILLPIFASVGSMGGLQVFSSDRQKGTLEYLLAYGVSPRRLFLNVLLTSLSLVSVILAVSVSIGVGVYVAGGNPLDATFVELLLIYGFPMSYAASAFASTVGMYWTSLSSPSAGLNSPIGFAPLLGILPPVGTLFGLVALGIAGYTSPTTFLELAGVAIGILAGVVALLLGLIGRLLRRERLLSPA